MAKLINYLGRKHDMAPFLSPRETFENPIKKVYLRELGVLYFLGFWLHQASCFTTRWTSHTLLMAMTLEWIQVSQVTLVSYRTGSLGLFILWEPTASHCMGKFPLSHWIRLWSNFLRNWGCLKFTRNVYLYSHKKTMYFWLKKFGVALVTVYRTNYWESFF